MATGTVSIRGVDLVTDVAGSGVDMIWGHGLTSSMASEDAFGLLDMAAIRETARVVRYDARGHGESGSTPDPEAFSWHELALDQLALADAIGIDRYVAAGASMGAATALHAAVLAPRRVSALVLMIPPTAWHTRAAQVDLYRAGADLVEAGQSEVLIAAAAERPGPDPLSETTEWFDRYRTTLLTTDPTRLARVMRGAATADLPAPEAIAGLAQPTLILAWTGDPGHPVATAARLAELIPHAELHVASRRAELDAWTATIRAFLLRCGERSDTA